MEDEDEEGGVKEREKKKTVEIRNDGDGCLVG